jgi:hypothetical protein
MRLFLPVLLLFAAEPAGPVDWDTIRLAEVQNKIAAARYLKSLDFHLCTDLVQALIREQDSVLQIVRAAASKKVDVEAALEEHVRVAKAKDEHARKLTLKFAERRAKAAVKAAELAAKWERSELGREKALGMTVLALWRDIEAVSSGDTQYAPAYFSSVAITYAGDRGRVVRTIEDATKQLVELERRRLELKARLEVLKLCKTALENIDFLTNPQEWVLKKIDQMAVEIAAASFNDESRDYLRKTLGQVRRNVAGAWEQWERIDRSIGVNVPDQTRQMARAFAVLGAVFKSIAQGMRESGVEGAAGIVLETIEYFAEAFGLVFAFGQAMDRILARSDQGEKGWRGVGVWAKILAERGEIRQDDDAAAYGIRIAISQEKKGACYLALSDAEYEEITEEQRRRLVLAACDERILNAWNDAAEGLLARLWRGTGKRAGDMIRRLGDDDAFHERDRQDLEARIREVARKSPLQPRVLLTLAREGQEIIRLHGKSEMVSARRLAELREEFLQKKGIDEFTRAAMGRPAPRHEWWMAYLEFERAIEKCPLAFSREQLAKLFNGFVGSGCDAAALARSLQRGVEARSGVTLGICSLERDSTDVVVDGLPPEVEAELEVRWSVPPGAPPKKIKVRNGVHLIATGFPGAERIEASAELTLPGGTKLSTKRAESFLKDAAPPPPAEVGGTLELSGGDRKPHLHWMGTLTIKDLKPYPKLEPHIEAFGEARDQAIFSGLLRVDAEGRSSYVFFRWSALVPGAGDVRILLGRTGESEVTATLYLGGPSERKLQQKLRISLRDGDEPAPMAEKEREQYRKDLVQRTAEEKEAYDAWRRKPGDKSTLQRWVGAYDGLHTIRILLHGSPYYVKNGEAEARDLARKLEPLAGDWSGLENRVGTIAKLRFRFAFARGDLKGAAGALEEYARFIETVPEPTRTSWIEYWGPMGDVKSLIDVYLETKLDVGRAKALADRWRSFYPKFWPTILRKIEDWTPLIEKARNFFPEEAFRE